MNEGDLTPQELRARYEADVEKATTFKPHGVSLEQAFDFLDTAEGRHYLASGCVPEETATVAVPTNVSTAALFDCADAAVRDLRRTDEQWNLRIDQRQVPGGDVFETGTFDEANVIGYPCGWRDAVPDPSRF